jgi:hypothetical protein
VVRGAGFAGAEWVVAGRDAALPSSSSGAIPSAVVSE